MIELPILFEAIEGGGYLAGLAFVGLWINETRRRIKRLEDSEELKKVCRYQGEPYGD